MQCSKISLGDAILTACYLINRMSSRVLNYKTPLNYLQESYPESHMFSSLDLKIFGCLAFVHSHDPHRTKLDPKAYKCIFLGYSATQKGYRCYSFEKRKYFTSLDVTFFEDTPFFPEKIQGENLSGKFFNKKDFLEGNSGAQDFLEENLEGNLEGNSSPIVNQWEYFWETASADPLDEPKNLNLNLSKSYKIRPRIPTVLFLNLQVIANLSVPTLY